jgi:hypothetical protein
VNLLIPEANKRPGVCYAVTDDGIELPVIDITHPAFATELTEAELAAVVDLSLRALEAAKKMAPEMVRALAEKSILVRGTVQSSGTFMSGMITYLYRLGPQNLGDGYASAIDRQAAGGLMARSFRFRLRDVARAMAATVMAAAATPGAPLHLIDIAGGPSAASLNALILLRKEHPERLEGRPIRIHVLDIDRAGPSFGERALAALLAEGAPLAGLDARLEHVPYDWTDPCTLRRTIEGFEDGRATAACSEGGLFDYASDEQIIANLAALHDVTPEDFAVVAAVARDERSLPPGLVPFVKVQGRPAVRFLGLEALSKLAANAGWAVARVLDSPLHHVATLKKA